MRTACLAVGLALAVTVGGCSARVPALQPEPEMPALSPPPAPPRIVASYPEPEPIAPVELAAPAEPVTTPRPQPRPPASAAAPEPERRDAPPVAPAPALTLTPTPGTEAKTEASIRALIGRTSAELARVNSGSLSGDKRTQFDTARRFVQQAEDALKSKNLVFAGKLADKAATMAAVLVR